MTLADSGHTGYAHRWFHENGVTVLAQSSQTLETLDGIATLAPTWSKPVH